MPHPQHTPTPTTSTAEVTLPSIAVHNIRGLALTKKLPTPFSTSGKWLSLSNATQNVDVLAITETQTSEDFPANKFCPFGPRLKMCLYSCPRRQDGGCMIFYNPLTVTVSNSYVIEPGRILKLCLVFNNQQFVFYSLYFSAVSAAARSVSIDLLRDDIVSHQRNHATNNLSPPPIFAWRGLEHELSFPYGS